jgi:hypothetical protein
MPEMKKADPRAIQIEIDGKDLLLLRLRLREAIRIQEIQHGSNAQTFTLVFSSPVGQSNHMSF